MRRCQKFFFSFFFLLIGVPDAPLSEIFFLIFFSLDRCARCAAVRNRERARERESARSRVGLF
jgi:hypothetical protein